MRDRFWLGWLTGMVSAGVVAFVVPYTGLVNMAATGKPNFLDRAGHEALDSALRWHAPSAHNPSTAAAATRQGFDVYQTECVTCHGAPDVAPNDFVKAMLPPPPRLWSDDTQQMPDGELFWIVKNGVRMTGMPAFGPQHDDRTIWEIVGFLRQLGHLDPRQTFDLQTVARCGLGG